MMPAWLKAAERGDADHLQEMIRRGEADVDSCDRYGQTALIIVARRGHIDAARVLINANVELDWTAKYGLSALMLAILNGHGEIADLLINAGADTSTTGTGTPGFAGKNALALARERGATTITKLLESRRG